MEAPFCLGASGLGPMCVGALGVSRLLGFPEADEGVKAIPRGRGDPQFRVKRSFSKHGNRGDVRTEGPQGACSPGCFPVSTLNLADLSDREMDSDARRNSPAPGLAAAAVARPHPHPAAELPAQRPPGRLEPAARRRREAESDRGPARARGGTRGHSPGPRAPGRAGRTCLTCGSPSAAPPSTQGRGDGKGAARPGVTARSGGRPPSARPPDPPTARAEAHLEGALRERRGDPRRWRDRAGAAAGPGRRSPGSVRLRSHGSARKCEAEGGGGARGQWRRPRGGGLRRRRGGACAREGGPAPGMGGGAQGEGAACGAGGGGGARGRGSAWGPAGEGVAARGEKGERAGPKEGVARGAGGGVVRGGWGDGVSARGRGGAPTSATDPRRPTLPRARGPQPRTWKRPLGSATVPGTALRYRPEYCQGSSRQPPGSLTSFQVLAHQYAALTLR